MYFPGGSDGKESTCNAGNLGSIPGLGRSPGGGHGNPLQYSCLENPMDREAYSPWGLKEWNTLSDYAHSTYNEWFKENYFPILTKNLRKCFITQAGLARVDLAKLPLHVLILEEEAR